MVPVIYQGRRRRPRVAAGYADAVLADNPALYWRLGEASGVTADDETANNNDGTYTPNSAGAWTGGTLGQAGLVGDADTAALFNGTTGYAVVAASVIGNSPAAWTLEAWVSGAAQSNRMVVALGNSASGNAFLSLGTGASVVNNMRPRVFYRGDNNVTIADLMPASGFTAFDDTTHHVAATYGAGVLILYVDGQEAGRATGLAPGTLTLNRAAAGCIVRTSPGSFFAGTIDEAAIYGAELSPARILAHYTAGT